MTKLSGVKNAIMQVIYLLNGSIFDLLFYCHIILYREKVTSYEKFNDNLTFCLKLSGTFQRFNTIVESIEILKNS